MAWDDIVFGVLTGGLYNIGKTAYKAGEAVDSAGDAAEQAGIALAVIGTTIESLGKQLNSVLEEVEELITIKRLTPRDESDLWEEEKERLDDLKQKKAELENQLKKLGVDQPGDFSFDFWDFLTNPAETLKKLQLISALVAIGKEIHEILYQEPGVVTMGIYNAKEALERFNTIEQPKIEDILDSLDDNLEVSEEVIKEVKKLFVIKKKVPLLEVEISPEMKDKLRILELDKKYYRDLIGRTGTISTQLASAIEKIPVTKFDISEKGVKVAGVIGTIFDNANPVFKAEHRDTGSIVEVEKNVSGDSTKKLKKSDESATMKTIGSDMKKRDTSEFRTNISDKSISGTSSALANRDIQNISNLTMALAKSPKYSLSNVQPQGAKLSAIMNTKVEGYERTYAFARAKTAFYDRELLKNAKKIDRLKYRWEDEPGVIPQTLDELKEILETFKTEEQPRIDTVLDTLNSNLEESKDILERFRTEEQPRVDTVLDTLNGNLVESKETLTKINDSLDSAQGAVSFFNKNAKMIKLGLGVFCGVIFLDLLLALFVLIRMSLGL
ncbi:MAG: hypothetical protein K0A89_06395 [ANME-2 cluster archaeon]|nr:hypothetical protein [ANME-2 cluster archaeon]